MKNRGPIILRPVPIRSTGHFRAVIHTGHEYDQFGNVVREGIILRETKLGRNTITNSGFDRLLGGNNFNSIVMVAGSGNTAPSPSDTTLASYLGKSNTFASASTTRNTTPDINNEVWWRMTKRVTFGPSSLGGGSVNVAEAGIAHGSIGSVNGSSTVSARGLLVDEFDNPTVVSVNNAIEYLDLIWEYTEWIPASVTGSVQLDIDGVMTDFDYEVRPYNFDNTGGSFNSSPWVNGGAAEIPGWYPAGDATYTWTKATKPFAGPLGAITGQPFGNGTRAWIPIMGSSTYVNGSKTRSLLCTWLPLNGNVVGGIGAFLVDMGHTAWQVGFDPVIPKINTKQLDMTFTLTMDNR